jgi:radical SAM protein with 4Fe4S-binding SPASM domain
MKTKDTLNFMAKLTLLKVWNAFIVILSFYVAKFTKKPIQWGLPFNISIEPTTKCNLGCPECPSGLKSFTRPTGNMEVDFYNKILQELGDKLIYLYFYFQGEPYLHPKFLTLVKEASARKIYTVTSTNAHFLTERKAKETIESGLDRIIISIDGTTQETYENYRIGGSLEKVKEGTRNLVKLKKELNSATPHIIIQFLVVKPNEHQIDDIYKLGKELGVDEVKLKTAQIYDFENGSDLMPTIDQYSRYKKQADGKYKLKNDLLNHCWKLWHSCVITWDGKIVPCCFDKDAQHQLGDLNTKTFREIWQSDLYDSFRKKILKSRAEIDICNNCTEGTKVWAD